MEKTNENANAKTVGLRLLAAVLAVLIIAGTFTSCGSGGKKTWQGNDVISGKNGAATSDSDKGGGEQGNDEPVKAIDFATYDLESQKSNLSDYFGKPIVLNFWATWCGPCKREFPHFQDAYEKYGEDIQFMMVEVSAGLKGVKQVEEFMKTNKYSVPAFLDEGGEASAKYGISSIPVTLFIDKNGNVVDGCVGQLTREFLEEGIGRIKG